MNIDNALYTLNIAPDARQLTVFIDGEAIPQSRPKIATRGKNGVPLPHAIAYYKDASIYYRQQCEYCIKQAVQKSGIFFKDVALFCEVYIFYLSLRQKVRSLKSLLMSAQNFQKSSRTAITFLKTSQTQPRAWHLIQIAALFRYIFISGIPTAHRLLCCGLQKSTKK